MEETKKQLLTPETMAHLETANRAAFAEGKFVFGFILDGFSQDVETFANKEVEPQKLAEIMQTLLAMMGEVPFQLERITKTKPNLIHEA